jgi:hypothetical protein
MKTIIQSVETRPYTEIAVLPFLYEPPKNSELIINDNKYIVDNIRDVVENNTVTRYMRVFMPYKK